MNNYLKDKKVIKVNFTYSDGETVTSTMEFPMIPMREVLIHEEYLKKELQRYLDGDDTTDWENGFYKVMKEYVDFPVTYMELFLGDGKGPTLGSKIYNQLFSFWYGVEEDKENQAKTTTGRQDFDEVRDFIAPLEYAASRWGKTPAEIMKTMSFPEFKMGLEGLGYNKNAETKKGQKENERAVMERYTRDNKEKMNKEAEEIEKLLKNN